MQMELRHRVAQRVVVPLAQLFMEVFDREAAVELPIQAQYPLDLRHRGAPWRPRQASVVLTFQTVIAMTVTPAPEGALTDPKQFSRFHLAQLQPLRAAKNIRETHPAYPLVNARPVHEIPQSWRST